MVLCRSVCLLLTACVLAGMARTQAPSPEPRLAVEIRSKAPSVQVEIIGRDRSFYRILLRNQSPKAVTAFSVGMPDNDDRSSHMADSQSKELIGPGATYELQFGIPRSGAEIQHQRVNRLVEAILADTESDDDAKVMRIRSEVAQLQDDLDPQMVENVRSRFPGLPDQALPAVKFLLKTGLSGEKHSVTYGLQEFERNRSNYRDPTLAKWWSTWRGR